jgi:hypothetical protein
LLITALPRLDFGSIVVEHVLHRRIEHGQRTLLQEELLKSDLPHITHEVVREHNLTRTLLRRDRRIYLPCHGLRHLSTPFFAALVVAAFLHTIARLHTFLTKPRQSPTLQHLVLLWYLGEIATDGVTLPTDPHRLDHAEVSELVQDEQRIAKVRSLLLVRLDAADKVRATPLELEHELRDLSAEDRPHRRRRLCRTRARSTCSCSSTRFHASARSCTAKLVCLRFREELSKHLHLAPTDESE